MTSKNKLKVLGEGSYGCVISKPLPCDKAAKVTMITDKKKDNRKHVAKLFYEKYKYDNEVRFGKITKKIDPREEKILSPISGCPVDKKIFKQPDNINALSKCELFTDAVNTTDYYIEQFNFEQLKNKKIWQLTMPYGGLDIEKTLIRYKNPISVKSFVKMITPLFESIILLKKNKIVHQDIKIDNVLVHKRKALLIDFSLMLPFSGIYTERNYKRLKRKYRPNPPEYYIVSLVMKNNYDNSDNHKINEISNINKNGMIMETKNYLMQHYINHLEKIQHYFHPYYTMNELISLSNYDQLITNALKDNKMFNDYIDRVDIYAIGTTIAELDQYIAKPHNNQDYVSLMRGILHPDPRYRMTPEDAVSLCNKISSAKNKPLINI